MAEIVKRNKAMSVSPLKSSQPVGAALAFLGLHHSIPMMHGSQGCTAFAKVFFVRHFREPIPLQTTAIDQVSAVMGGDDSVVQGLATIAEKSKPALIGVMTTGLTETQGADLNMAVKSFRTKHPEFDAVPVVPVATPDFSGCLESGYAAAVTAMIHVLVPEGGSPGKRKRQVNILAGSWLTPGDVEALKETVEAFGLRPVVLPDLSGSLDGHLFEGDFTPLTDGGLAVDEIATLGDAAATLVIGASMFGAADLLNSRTGVPDHRFDTLMGLDANDKLMTALAAISGAPVPERFRRQRAQLQDAMVDTHFMTGMRRAAIAADPDLLYVLSDLIVSMGGEVVAAVAPSRAPIIEKTPAAQVKIGDLEDLEAMARAGDAELVIGNSHAVMSGERLGVPVLRAGFPQYDWVGGYQKVWIGYKGTRQALFDLANLMLGTDQHAIAPYRSMYAVRPGEGGSGEQHPSIQDPGTRH